MQVLISKAKSFHRPPAEFVTLWPSVRVQAAPDWIRDTETFRLGQQDGSIVEVNYQIVNPAPAAAPQTGGQQ